MTPKLKKATNMENVLEAVLTYPFNEKEKTIAQELMDKWTEDDWGAEEEAHPQPQDDDMEDTGLDQAEEKLPNQKI
ncbi:hypothetical protein LTS18_013417 [Coniosporium uncinatum]|uniref:Uncharacterized protein n=1 Tax=Coniosporium uncinatum TaxID=93489 RepID=A0ACC3DI43_9PEZI|nr:hypothetical protein LTS18_013417 [Coniosporium uncinatum]